MKKQSRRIWSMIAAASLCLSFASAHAALAAQSSDPVAAVCRTGWVQDQGTWYYVKADGALRTGWLYWGNNWYYFNSGGAMRTGWLLWRGDWYYFDAGGAMRTGWLSWRGAWYYFDANGAMVTGWSYCGTNDSIYYFTPDGAMYRGWLDWGQNRYYFQWNGKMANYWCVIDGVYQAFEPDGRWASARTALPWGDAERMANLTNWQWAVLSACDWTPYPGANLCAGWVSNVFANAGLGGVAGDACDIAYAWASSSDINALKPGMIIAVPTHPRTEAGRIWGHVGIYVGNGLVRDSARTGLRIVDLGSWIGWYGATYPVKWGWANGVALG